MNAKKILVTGSCGFIGFHLSNLLLKNGFEVIGIDNLDPYYDVGLKRARNNILKKFKSYKFFEKDISVFQHVEELLPEGIDKIVHLAAQAGVRYSIDKPEKYVTSNLLGCANILELARLTNVSHLLLASTSSAYGANTDMPFAETQNCSHPLSFYAATKQANELMSHSYSNIFRIPTTAFRFFTVYGPWGRPDMALFKFTKAIIEGSPIDVYNHGKMQRDFTFVTDLARSIMDLLEVTPVLEVTEFDNIDSKSPVAPWRLVNIGNAAPTDLMDYINAIETVLGKKAEINFLPMQPGDVEKTYANVSLLKALTGRVPNTTIDKGVTEFVTWYQDYYRQSKKGT